MANSFQKQLKELQQKTLMEGLNKLYDEQVLCDTTVEAENQQIKAHKCILAAFSPYFRAMFTFNSDPPEEVFKLHSMSGQVLCDIVQFLYTGHINIDDNNIQALTSAANMLGIEPLLKFCIEYMSTALCIENCLEVFMFADFLSLTSLKENVESYILDNFTAVYKTEPFLSLDCSTLARLLKSDDLNVMKEETVYDSIMMWIKHDLVQRRKDLPLLLLNVRLLLINLDYLRTVVCEEKLISENTFCYHLVQQNVTCISEGKLLDSSSFMSNPRLGMFEKEMLIFSGGSFSFGERAFSCIDLNSCESHYSIEPHSSFDFKYKLDLYRLVTTSKNEIFCIGGIFFNDYHFQRDSAEASSAVMRYNQRGQAWIPMPSMPTGKCGFACCYYKGFIYVFGGYQFYPGKPPSDETMCFDVDAEVWSAGQNMPLKMALQAVATLKDKAYLFGGKDEADENLPLVLQYGLETDQWAIVDSNIHKPMSEATAVTCRDKIFLLGGSNRNGYMESVVAFEPDRLRWSFCTDFPEHRKLLAIAGSENSIYVFGGVKHLQLRPGALRGGRTVECKDLYRYDVDKNVWIRMSHNVKHANCYACCVALVNIKFLKPNESHVT